MGDLLSTVKVGTKGQQGWGDPLIEMFDRSRINVVNYARGGRSSRARTRDRGGGARGALRRSG